MTRLRLAIGSLLAAVLLFTTQAQAAAPDTLGYQGRLTQNGIAITGSVSVVFSLYNGASGGSALWSETQSVRNLGLTVFLGSSPRCTCAGRY